MVDYSVISIDGLGEISSNFYIRDKKASQKRALLGMSGNYDSFDTSYINYIINKSDRVYINNLYYMFHKYRYGFDEIFDQIGYSSKLRQTVIENTLNTFKGKQLQSRDKIFELDFNDNFNHFDDFSLFVVNMLYSFYILYDCAERERILNKFTDELLAKHDIVDKKLKQLIGNDYLAIYNKIYKELSIKKDRTELEEQKLEVINEYRRYKQYLSHGVELNIYSFKSSFSINSGSIKADFITDNRYYHIHLSSLGKTYCLLAECNIEDFNDKFRISELALLSKEKRIKKYKEIIYNTSKLSKVVLDNEKKTSKMHDSLILSKYFISQVKVINEIMDKSNGNIVIYTSSESGIEFAVNRKLDIVEALKIITDAIKSANIIQYYDKLSISPNKVMATDIWETTSSHSIPIKNGFYLNTTYKFDGGSEQDIVAYKQKAIDSEV